VTDPTLIRVLGLRRGGEQRALERLTKHEAVRRRSARDADAATSAVARHVHDARALERELLASLLGRAVLPTMIERVQSSLDAVVREEQRLRGLEEAAHVRLRDQCVVVDTAREEFHRRRRAAARLDLVLRDATARETRRHAALTEHADEEQVGTRAFPGKVDTGFPTGNATNIESRALSIHGPSEFVVDLNGKRSGAMLPGSGSGDGP
jgi:hypothetical protein